MKNQPLALLLVALAAATAACGCSVRVDLADESTTTAEAPPSTITEKSRTAVSLALFTDNQSQSAPVASEKSKTVQSAREPAFPPATPEPPSRWVQDPKSSQSDRKSVTLITNFVNVVEKDVHRHTHYHSAL